MGGETQHEVGVAASCGECFDRPFQQQKIENRDYFNIRLL